MNHYLKHQTKYFLSKHPLCAKCQREGKYTKATTVIRVLNHLESRCDKHNSSEYGF